MNTPKKFTTMIGETELSLEFGKMALKADVSIVARMGDTCVLTTVCIGGETTLDYFPLSVEYVEKLYAGGKIKGSRWVKREGRPSDEAVITGRLIDRTIRPLFPKAFKREVQVVCTLLSVDHENSPEILSAIAVSAALHVSQAPWEGPTSTMRVGYITAEGEDCFIINPAMDVMDTSKMDLVVSSNPKKVLMIETLAEELPEKLVLQGIEQAHEVNTQITTFIESIRKEIGHPKIEVIADENMKALKELFNTKYAQHVETVATKKSESDGGMGDTLTPIMANVMEENPDFQKKDVAAALDECVLDYVRNQIFNDKKRLDGRAMDELREITIETDLLARTHGSALFQRGMTQVLSIATLGSTSLEQFIESPGGEESKRYIHHYFSPPYSYGEAGRMFGPGRREIGHGALAEKALEPVLPSRDQFPYAIRVVSEVMSSNGSTSMASTCGSTLALMDAGVPIKAPVAGISIGLMFKSDTDYTLLTDIAGIEDFAGHMDFKVAGTTTGVTAIQLDVKNDGLTQKMMEEIFVLARTAREAILKKMEAAISKPRENVSKYAPKVVMLTPPEDKIGEIIGPGGKNIKRIIATTGTNIDISDDGKVSISGVDMDAVNRAADTIRNIYKEVKPGEIYEGEIVRLLPIGAMVEIIPGRDGLVHVSKLSRNFVKDVRDVVSEGQRVRVQVTGIDERGRINLSMVFDEKGDHEGSDDADQN
ncbi:polyribonucleotide nucleotidyltransferase [Candidatus Woesebacteria bacterium]|nr:polyribonucleotide nucleotidyltransferase [Candidatus Woesebacteria bacterium]